MFPGSRKSLGIHLQSQNLPESILGNWNKDPLLVWWLPGKDSRDKQKQGSQEVCQRAKRWGLCSCHCGFITDMAFHVWLGASYLF